MEQTPVEWLLSELQDKFPTQMKAMYNDNQYLLENITLKAKEKENDILANLIENVDRFEVIDHTAQFKGRCYTKYNCEVELSIQDDGKTLKTFITDRND